MFKTLRLQFGSNMALALCFMVLIGSLSLNVILANKYRALFAPHNSIQVGSSLLNTVRVTDLNGNKETITTNQNHPSVLYIMSPTCIWCARNIENIRSLARQSGAQYTFIGLSTTSAKLKEYVASTPLPFPIKLIDTKALPKDFDIGATPQMVVLDGKGKVQKVWTGALDGKRRSEVEEFFHAHLPGTISVDATKLM